MDAEDNPYKAPRSDDDVETKRVPQQSARGDRDLARYAHLFLRLLGLLFLVSGLTEIIFGLAYALSLSAEFRQVGMAAGPTPYSIASLAQGAAYLLAGAYFTVGGRWVLEKILLPSSLGSGTQHEDPVDADE